MLSPQQTTGFIKTKIKEIQSIEKIDFKTLKQKGKELAAVQKLFSNMSSKVEKLILKLAKTTNENKKMKLRDELNPCRSIKNDLAQQVESLQNSLAAWKQLTIQGKHREHRFRLIRRLSYMSLKLEGSRQIDARDIYRD